MELGDTTKAIFEAVERTNPRYVVFDGLSELRLLSGNALVYRRQLLALKDFFAQRNATVLLLDDRSSPFGTVLPESLVGGNIILDRNYPEYGRARRRLYVTKVRGANFVEGFHDYEIIQGGVVVHPRLIAADFSDRYPTTNCSSGIPNLDAILGGGLTTGSTTLLLGPAGSGKSTVAMQFAVHALQSGTKAAVYAFDEVLQTLFERTEKLCLRGTGGLHKFVDEKLLHVQQVDPAELTPGAFAEEVRRVVDAGVKMVVIDSLNGYLNAMPEDRYLSTHLHELFSYLNQKGVVTIVVVAQHGMFAGTQQSSDLDISYIADSVVLFRYFEAFGEIQQAVSVFKKRTGTHERSIRQLRVTAEGIEVGDPLSSFHGILTGVPRYEGTTRIMSDGPVQEGGG
jgi:circadian clock protein KaiC